MSVAATPWGGYGLVAKEEIAKGDTVLVLREEAVLAWSGPSRSRPSARRCTPFARTGWRRGLR